MGSTSPAQLEVGSFMHSFTCQQRRPTSLPASCCGPQLPCIRASTIPAQLEVGAAMYSAHAARA
eukprot:7690989-Karenia_brevis.AAC.1